MNNPSESRGNSPTSTRAIVRRVYGNLGKLLGGKALAGILSLAYMVIAVRALGARDYGVLILVHTYTVTVGGIIEFPGGTLSSATARRRWKEGIAIA